MKGKYVIVRGDRSGVFAGTLVEQNGQEVVLSGVRRLRRRLRLRDGLFEINGQKIYRIDDTPTIITSVHGSVAKGFIMQSDLTLTPCYVVKGNNQFAHGIFLLAQ